MMFAMENNGTKDAVYKYFAVITMLIIFSLTPINPGVALGAGSVVVKEEAVNLRTAPGPGGGILGRAARGEKLEVLGKQGDWYRVSRGGAACWVAGWLVEPVVAQSGAAGDSAAGIPPSAASNAAGVSYTAEIIENGVNIRNSPGTSHPVLGQTRRGDLYPLLGRSGEWVKVSPGWVHSQFVRLAAIAPREQPQGTGWAVVNGADINIRSGPGTNYQVLSRASQGERYMLADRSADWYKIVMKDGKSGWIASWLVNLDGNPAVNSSPGAGQLVAPPPPSAGPPSAPGRPAAKLSSVSARAEGDRTVLTVQSLEPLSYSITSLNDPDRLIIDIKGHEPGAAPENISLSTPLTAGVRVGLFSRDPLITRIVVDLKSRIRYDRNLSPDGRQLQVVLTSRTGRSLSGLKVVLDPGHGGTDPGAIGLSGVKEKDVNLDIAQKTAQYLRNMGAAVILTRTGDSYLDLPERPNVADRSGAAIFVSVHANANPSRDSNGTSTYFLRTPGEGMDQVRFESMYLAGYIQKELVRSINRQDKGVLQADFVVLARSKVPAALVEVAYISNPGEEKLLGDEAFRSRAAQAVARGIADYFAAR